MKDEEQKITESESIQLVNVDDIWTESRAFVYQSNNIVHLSRGYPDPSDLTREVEDEQDFDIFPEDLPALIEYFISLLPHQKLRRVK